MYDSSELYISFSKKCISLIWKIFSVLERIAKKKEICNFAKDMEIEFCVCENIKEKNNIVVKQNN